MENNLSQKINTIKDKEINSKDFIQKCYVCRNKFDKTKKKWKIIFNNARICSKCDEYYERKVNVTNLDQCDSLLVIKTNLMSESKQIYKNQRKKNLKNNKKNAKYGKKMNDIQHKDYKQSNETFEIMLQNKTDIIIKECQLQKTLSIETSDEDGELESPKKKYKSKKQYQPFPLT